MTKEFTKKLAKVDFYYDYLENIDQYNVARDLYLEVSREADNNKKLGKLFQAAKSEYFK